MKKIASLGVVLFALTTIVALTGCKDKSPEGVCSHYMEVTKVDKDKLDDEMKDCTEDLTKMKEKMGDKWDKFATCILDASDKDTMEKCEPED
ncbi:MAG: hypothetical protein AUK47_10255 [Deltaproteobacteria bacterium CG2_30_63_29]|nr:MAG: hypothetical protein AUK47_10255 [Deltaproteobacteria bacterium CG2_30_63_29]PJB47943.1 MAG: hypothetical protein CO108_03260 [Deltaproteobacteria bacterium CG_4_9_14_3_um_filter_63_12]